MESQDFTTQEFSMSSYPSRKRARSNSYSYGNRPYFKRPAYRSRIPRNLRSRAVNGRDIHCLTGSASFALDGDLGISFAWDTAAAYINRASGLTTQTITGLTELASVYEMLRLAKVEMIILPPANTIDYMNQVDSGTRTILPIVRMAPDYNDNDVPTRDSILQEPALKTDVLDKVLRFTLYPKLEGSNGLIDVGANQKNIFMQASLVSSQKWHGAKVFFDMNSVYLPNSNVTVEYKLYYECIHSK